MRIYYGNIHPYGWRDKSTPARGGTDDWEKVMEGQKMKKIVSLMLMIAMLIIA